MKRCVHSAIHTPLRIVWGAVEVPLGHKAVLSAWEAGRPERWARSVLTLPVGYEWSSEEILWHAGEESRNLSPKLSVWPVVFSRAVRLISEEGDS